MWGSGRRRFVQVLVGASLVGVVGRSAYAAAGVRAEIALSTTRVRVGDRVVMKLSVISEDGGSVPEPPLPDGLDASFSVTDRGGGTSTSAVFDNGRLTRTTTRAVTAMIVPSKPGEYPLSFSVDVGGRTVRSNEVTLEVLAADEEIVAESETGKPTQARGDVFAWASVDKQTAYVGEQITYRLDVYERRRFLNMHLRKPPSFTDFFTEALPEGEPHVEDVAGVGYRVRPGLARALFAQRAGTLSIGPAELSIGLRRREQSQTIDIEVKPLPADGQPEGFSPNNVGKYTIDASVDRTDVDPGQPLTLTVTIEGTGNIAFIDPGPWPEIEGARRYEPKIETQRHGGAIVGGTRTYKVLVIPEQAGKLVIPAHELHYFDPEAEAYAVARTEPIELAIGGSTAAMTPTADEAGQQDSGDGDEAVSELAEVITAESVPRHVPGPRWLTPTRWLYAMVAVPIAVTSGLIAGTVWRRFGPDERARARARERARRRELLESARAAVETGEGFYAAVAKLMQEIAVQRAGPSGVGLPRPELLRRLGHAGVSDQDVAQLQSLLDRCDAARFGAQQDTRAEREALLDEALALSRASTLAKGGS